MPNIGYGDSNDPNLPQVNLPSLNPDSEQQRPQITINRQPQPQDQTGGWGTFAPAAAPQQAASADTQTGGWASFSPKDQTPPAEVSSGEAGLRGAAHGLTFGFYPAMAGAVSGAKAALSGEGDFSTAYDKTRQQEEDAYKESAKQHPYISAAGDVAGAIPSLFVPGLGISKAGMMAAETLPRIFQAIKTGGIAGGLMGAGDKTSEGGSVGDIAMGAAGGAATGAALGGVLGSGIEGATKIGQRVGSIVRGQRDPEAEAARLVVGALKGDQKQVMKTAGDVPALNAAQAAGTDVRLADYGGGNTKALLKASANISPEARDIIGEPVFSRFEQQGTRVGRYIRSHFGSDRGADTDALKALADKANDPAYAAAYKAGARGIWNPELQRLAGAPSVQDALFGAVKPLRDRGIVAGYNLPRSNPFIKVQAKNGAIELKKDAKGNEVYPELAFWDQAVRNLGGKIGELQRAGNNTRARDLIQLKNQLTDELDKLVPAYGNARSGAAKFFKARDASDAGAKFVTDTSITERDALKAIAQMSGAERELFKRGFASQISDTVERISDNRSVLNSIFLNNSAAHRRILIALGKDGADRLESLLRVEGIVDRTRKALGNSTTIQQGHDTGKFATSLATIEGLKGAFNPAYLVAIPLIWGGRKAAKEIDERVFTHVAELLMSENPAVLSRGLDIAAKNPTVRTALRYASDLSAHELISLLGPSGVASAALTLGKHFKGAAQEAPPHAPHDQQDNQGQQVAPP
jgi:hypothetical protein